MAETDLALFPVKTALFLGGYESVITEAEDVEELTEQQREERDLFVLRAKVGLGQYDEVAASVDDDSPLAYSAVKKLAEFLSSSSARQGILSQLKEWSTDPACQANSAAMAIAGQVFLAGNEPADALRCCHAGQDLEQMAVCVQALLAMNRVDEAEKKLKAMQAADETATLSQLCTAWVGLALGGRGVQEAAYILQELGDRFHWTPALHSGLAVAKLRMGQVAEALSCAQEALALDPNHADSLATMIACQLHMGQPADDALAQLREVAPEHSFVDRMNRASEAFSEAASPYS
ncbi:unnamed protein product [Pedinophyceae sp. YPF-701]|nr:unnamed protein product [Pedinophyceae sp. YPF-701]